MTPPLPLKKKEILVLALVMVGLAGIFYKPIFSCDIWHHLKMGEYIIQHDYILPEADPFSYTTDGKSLIHHEWLAQIILNLVHKSFGFMGLRVLRVTLLLLSLAFVFWTALKLSRRFFVALLVLLITAYLFRTRYMIRPELFSLLFFTFLYTWFLTARRRCNYPYYAFFFLLCVLWINLHPFMIFIGGLISLLILGQGTKKLPGIAKLLRFRSFPCNPMVLFLLFLVASLINPYGYGIYEYILKATPVVKQYIQEWQPIFVSLQSGPFRSITGGVLAFPLIMKALVSGIIIVFLVVLVGSYARKMWWALEDILMGLLMIYMAISAARFAWLLFVPILLVLKYANYYTRNRKPPEKLKQTIVVLLWTGVAVFSGYWLKEAYCRIPYNFTNEIQRKNYPVIPVKILQDANLAGRLYNPSCWGGYLLYHLYPDHKVFIDTRTHLHGESSVVNSMVIQYQYPGFEKLIEKFDFDILLLKKMFGDKRPFSFPNWILIFENASSAMYLKDNARNEGNLKNIVDYYKERNISFDPTKGFDREHYRLD